jgi:hypothetical protein
LLVGRRIAIHFGECCTRGINVRWYESVDHWGGEGVCKIVFEVGVSLQVMQDIDTLPVSSSQWRGFSSLNCTDVLLPIKSRASSSREMICSI